MFSCLQFFTVNGVDEAYSATEMQLRSDTRHNARFGKLNCTYSVSFLHYSMYGGSKFDENIAG